MFPSERRWLRHLCVRGGIGKYSGNTLGVKEPCQGCQQHSGIPEFQQHSGIPAFPGIPASPRSAGRSAGKQPHGSADPQPPVHSHLSPGIQSESSLVVPAKRNLPLIAESSDELLQRKISICCSLSSKNISRNLRFIIDSCICAPAPNNTHSKWALT